MAGNVTYVIDDDLPSNNLVRQIVFIILVMYITNSASIFGHYANCEWRICPIYDYEIK